ncbi:MAG: hypothetical protein Kapaf2KO_16920 [Candidatus Kapaibacteriales bacterium]
MKQIAILILASIFFLYSCDDDPVSNTISTEVSVLSFNLYPGGKLERLETTSTTDELPDEIRDMYLVVQNTSSPARFAALAEQIENLNPDVVALQDVALWRFQQVSDFDVSPVPNAESVAFDHKKQLIEMIDNLSLGYTVVAESEFRDWEFPARIAQSDDFQDVRMTLSNLILVKNSIARVGNEESAMFNNEFTLLIKGVEEDLEYNYTNGYQKVTLQKGDITFDIINSSLIKNVNLTQTNQAAQIANIVDDKPTIVTIDLNNEDDSDAYLELEEKYDDVWKKLKGGQSGYTCCAIENLSSTSPNNRENFIFSSSGNVQANSIDIIGDGQNEKVNGSSSISESYGLFGRFRVVVPE